MLSAHNTNTDSVITVLFCCSLLHTFRELLLLCLFGEKIIILRPRTAIYLHSCGTVQCRRGEEKAMHKSQSKDIAIYILSLLELAVNRLSNRKHDKPLCFMHVYVWYTVRHILLQLHKSSIDLVKLR